MIDLLDRDRFSLGLLEEVIRHLLKRDGAEPSQARQGEELGVTQAMISRVAAGKKHFSTDIFQKYAARRGLALSELCGLIQRAPLGLPSDGGVEQARPCEPGIGVSPADERVAGLLQSVLNEADRVRGLACQVQFPRDSLEARYAGMLGSAFGVLKDAGRPVRCAALYFRRRGTRVMVIHTGLGGDKDRPIIVKYCGQAPGRVGQFVDRAWGNVEAGGPDDGGERCWRHDEVTCGGGAQGDDGDPFWAEFVGPEAPRAGRKLVLFQAILLAGPRGHSVERDEDAVSAVFAFDHSYVLAKEDVRAMLVLSDLLRGACASAANGVFDALATTADCPVCPIDWCIPSPQEIPGRGDALRFCESLTAGRGTMRPERAELWCRDTSVPGDLARVFPAGGHDLSCHPDADGHLSCDSVRRMAARILLLGGPLADGLTWEAGAGKAPPPAAFGVPVALVDKGGEGPETPAVLCLVYLGLPLPTEEKIMESVRQAALGCPGVRLPWGETAKESGNRHQAASFRLEPATGPGVELAF